VLLNQIANDARARSPVEKEDLRHEDAAVDARLIYLTSPLGRRLVNQLRSEPNVTTFLG
jgi:hypothetical protein